MCMRGHAHPHILHTLHTYTHKRAKVDMLILDKTYLKVNKENVTHTNNGLLFNHEIKMKYVLGRKMVGTGDPHVRWNKPDSGRLRLMFYLI